MTQSRQLNDFNPSELEAQKGLSAFDSDKKKLGTVEDIYLDDEGQAKWALVKMGSIKSSEAIAPLDSAYHMNDGIHLSVAEDKIKSAPSQDVTGKLEDDFEAKLSEHYGLEKPTQPTDSSQSQSAPDEMPIPVSTAHAEPSTAAPSLDDQTKTVTLMEERLIIQKKLVPKQTVKMPAEVFAEQVGPTELPADTTVELKTSE